MRCKNVTSTGVVITISFVNFYGAGRSNHGAGVGIGVKRDLVLGEKRHGLYNVDLGVEIFIVLLVMQ